MFVISSEGLPITAFLLFTTIICVSTDIGGYIFGKIFKGPKLTKFSPNKTYAGMIGGYFLSTISAVILTNLYYIEELPIKWFFFVILISDILPLLPEESRYDFFRLHFQFLQSYH